MIYKIMDEESLINACEKLQGVKNIIEKEDGHNIESIFVSEEYNQDGIIVKGISIHYSNEVQSNSFVLKELVEKIVNRNVQWLRFSPKGYFFYFK